MEVNMDPKQTYININVNSFLKKEKVTLTSNL